MHMVSDIKLAVFMFGPIKHSLTMHTLTKIIHKWAQLTDDAKLGNLVKVLFLHYFKVFDQVNQNLLITKQTETNGCSKFYYKMDLCILTGQQTKD